MTIKTIKIDKVSGQNIVEAFDNINNNFAHLLEAITNTEVTTVTVTGEKGDTGLQGLTGKDGRDGKDGEQGPAGKDGKDGKDGANGADGLPGVNGKDGADGLPGRDGINGKDGKDGLPGKDGAQGIQGLPGKDGKDGANGKDGAQGIQGIQGPAGKDGAQGPAGPQGIAGANAPVASLNQKQYIPSNIVSITGVGQTVLSTTFTTNGNPVFLIATGDANPINGGSWCRLQWFRNGTAIGKPTHLESGQANVNITFCVQTTDTPAAGTWTYSLQTVNIFGPNSFQFGESDPPVANFIELASAVGPAGAGVSNTVVQNSITLGATANAPSVATRTVQRIESQVIGDKVRLTYKLGQVAAAQGSGEYLLTLPAGMTFNQTYNPVYNGGIWVGGVNAMAPYYIPAAGGIIIDGSWSNQIMVVPYDSTRFRLALTNNVSQTTYGFWNSGWYATNAGSGINLQLSFEIWK